MMTILAWSSSATMLRRFCCFSTSSYSCSCSASATFSTLNKKKRLVFLGSPQVSTLVLDALFSASSASDSLFEVAAIVTQPPSGRDRGRKVMPSPVAQYALDKGFPSDLIFTPVKAGEESFLGNFKSLEPELCVTAAYGNILPSKFLRIPSLGTVNIHPSLLPLYRGAAPVQRALEDGVKETGVSLAFTVRQLDAGPIIAHQRMDVDDQIKAPELLELLFAQGSELLVRELPSIFDGSARRKAEEQDESKATLAPKITPEESYLSFDQEAINLHNKVRAFAGWPGARARVMIVDPQNGQSSTAELKIITTRVYNGTNAHSGEADDVLFTKGSLIFPCGGQTALEVLEVQLPGKKVVNASAFWNGLRDGIARDQTYMGYFFVKNSTELQQLIIHVLHLLHHKGEERTLFSVGLPTGRVLPLLKKVAFTFEGLALLYDGVKWLKEETITYEINRAFPGYAHCGNIVGRVQPEKGYV